MTEKELMELIAAAEADLTQAPSDLKEKTLAKAKPPESKMREFRKYYTKVIAGMVAAITLLYTTPMVTNHLGIHDAEFMHIDTHHSGTILGDGLDTLSELIETQIGGNTHEKIQ